MRKIYPCSLIRIIGIIILSVVFGVSPLLIIVLSVIEQKSVIYLLFAVILEIIFLVELVCALKKKIVFNTDCIYVPTDKTFLLRKIQYEVKAYYKDISDIKIIISNRNSKNKSEFGMLTPMPYLMIEQKNGKKELINLFYYSKRQCYKIIDDLKYMAELQGNELNVPSGKELIDDMIHYKNFRRLN